MIKIEALERVKSDGFAIETGDIFSVHDDVAHRWCTAGWAKTPGGECKTGERRVIMAVVQPLPAAHSQKAQEVR